MRIAYDVDGSLIKPFRDLAACPNSFFSTLRIRDPVFFKRLQGRKRSKCTEFQRHLESRVCHKNYAKVHFQQESPFNVLKVRVLLRETILNFFSVRKTENFLIWPE